MKKEDCYKLFISMHLSEKVTNMNGLSKYCFKVIKTATKTQIKEALKVVFDAEAVDVNIINQKPRARVFKGTKGATKAFKKAVVTLAQGKTLDLGA